METQLDLAWHALARQAAGLAFDEAYPLARRSWLCRQYGDWAAVLVAVEAETD